MSFMQVQKTCETQWYILEDDGDTYYPYEDFSADAILEHARNKDARLGIVTGFGVRLSAPGYLDCTDWEVYEDEDAADNRVLDLEEEEEENGF
jgi:hypothetical protein